MGKIADENRSPTNQDGWRMDRKTNQMGVDWMRYRLIVPGNFILKMNAWKRCPQSQAAG